MNKDLEEIREQYNSDVRFAHMRYQFIKYVPGEGNDINPTVMVIGEAPGKMENFHQKPFKGSAGALLREYFDDAYLYHDNTYITNIVKYRPLTSKQENRTPAPKEVKDSWPYLLAEWRALGSPKVIVPVGGVASSLFIPNRSITDIAGDIFVLDQFGSVFPMVHPSYILRNIQLKEHYRKHWRHLGLWLDAHC